MNNEDISSITEAILGNSDYRIYNRESCLKGKPLEKLKESITHFNDNQLNRNQFFQNVLIAYRLHRKQIPTEMQQVVAENKDKGKNEEKEYNLTDPQKWSPTLTKQQLITKAEFLVTILGKAIEKAKPPTTSRSEG